MATLKVKISQDKMDFWNRKKEEIKRQHALAGREDKVTNDTMMEGLLDLWMKLEEQEVKDA
jgi:hypothetical protein